MRVGIFGGTFDPPHNGHVAALKEFINKCGTDRTLVIPTGVPPHKTAGTTSDKDRLEMAALAFGDFPDTEICDYEIKKGGKSYTVDTLEWLRSEYPEAEFVLYTGSDMFLSLHRWRNAEKILSLCSAAAFSRTGSDRAELDAQAEFLRKNYGADVSVYDFEPEVVSSSGVRLLIETGGNWASLVPGPVRDYIEKNGLYSSGFYSVKKLLRERLSEKRYVHSLGVAKTAAELAVLYGADPKKAELAGLLHDVTKNLDPKEQIEFCEKNGIPLTEDDRLSPKVIHAVSGEWFLKNIIGITDSEILSAVRYHTTGRKGITLLEKIIYVSDFTEPSRNYSDADYYRGLSKKDLDTALFEGMKWIIGDKRKNGEPVHRDSLEMYEMYIKNGFGEKKKGQNEMIEEMVKKAVNALYSKGAADIKVIKIEEITTLASYFVICSGTSTTQVRTLADECEFKMEQGGYKIGHREGKPEGGWILLDYYDVIVHVYTKEARKFYDLERFWKDGEEVDAEKYIEKKE